MVKMDSNLLMKSEDAIAKNDPFILFFKENNLKILYIPYTYTSGTV